MTTFNHGVTLIMMRFIHQRILNAIKLRIPPFKKGERGKRGKSLTR